jgi:hypothetical protein
MADNVTAIAAADSLPITDNCPLSLLASTLIRMD